MRLKRILKATAVTIAAMTLFTIPVMAESGWYDFHVEANMDDTQYTGNVQKGNNNNYAQIWYNSSDLNEYSDFSFCVVGQSGDDGAKTTQSWPTGPSGYFEPSYLTGKYQWNMYRLRGRTYAGFVNASGEWAP